MTATDDLSMAGSRREEEVQEQIARLDAYRNQLNAMLRQHELLRMSLGDHTRARQVLEEMERFDSRQEILLPVGGEVFVRAEPTDKDRVLLGLGRGVTVEMERPRALEMVNERILRLERSERELGEQIHRLEEQVAMISQRLELAAQQEASPNPPAGRDSHVGAP